MQVMNSPLYKYNHHHQQQKGSWLEHRSIIVSMATEEEKGCSNSSPASSRWNPTKEQISMLEAMYKQGIRTPTAEQIQQMAAKLREFGSIEGKNVFYWFQNHKARQRQKQKQETIACFNRFLRKATAVSPVPLLPHPVTLPPPAGTNVVCSPYYFPPARPGIGYYPPFPQVMVPGTTPGRHTEAEFKGIERVNEKGGYTSKQPIYASSMKDAGSHETLQLFPLHPTGILEEKTASSLHSTSTDSNSVLEEEEEGEGGYPVLNLL